MEEIRSYNSEEKKFKISRIVYYLLGIFEAVFAFRLVFKVLGANPGSGFVSFIYTISGIFMASFNGIFRTAVNQGIETKSVLEPSLIITMIVYALIAYGIVRIIEIYGDKEKERQ